MPVNVGDRTRLRKHAERKPGARAGPPFSTSQYTAWQKPSPAGRQTRRSANRRKAQFGEPRRRSASYGILHVASLQRLNNRAAENKFHGQGAPGGCLQQGLVHRVVRRRTAAILRGPVTRRDGRVAEGARLESVYTGNRIVGSNPTLSASASCEPGLRKKAVCFAGPNLANSPLDLWTSQPRCQVDSASPRHFLSKALNFCAKVRFRQALQVLRSFR